MPKTFLQIKDWSGGMNNRKDPRDLLVNEFSYISNMSIDALGKIKTAGGLYDAVEGSDGSTDLSYYIVSRTSTIAGGGGYGLFYFESDHSATSESTITETKSNTDLAIGTSAGTIRFVKVDSRRDSPADIPNVPQ
tara:strand:- start:12292 stop:12696 length:405 start_codon:yes stop_codon:yes gene_type:complete